MLKGVQLAASIIECTGNSDNTFHTNRSSCIIRSLNWIFNLNKTWQTDGDVSIQVKIKISNNHQLHRQAYK